MPTPSRNYVLAAFSGFATAVVALLCASQSSVTPTFPSSRFTFGPHPRDFVTLREGQAFTVPPGSALVVTAIGSNALFGQNPAHSVNLLVDGQTRLASTQDFSVLQIPQHTPRTNMLGVPEGCVALEGAVVTLSGGTPSAVDGRAWGYLAPLSAPVTNRIQPMLEYAPRAQDVVRITTAPYVVPPGRLFVPTALGLSNLGTSSPSTELLVWLVVDGNDELGAAVRTGDATHNQVSLQRIEGTAAFPAGTVLRIASVSGSFEPCAWGYLADA